MARDLLSVASDMQGEERVLLSVTRDGKGSGKCGVSFSKCDEYSDGSARRGGIG